MTNPSRTSHSETLESLGEIAIVGMAGRFPGAKTTGQFWQNLRDGIESISFFSKPELEAMGVDPAALNHSHYVKAGGALADIEFIDAAFFGFNPREAEVIDPQQRVFLECAWEVIENAGYDPETYVGKIGVYAGASVNTYFLHNLYPNRELIQSVGADPIRIANRLDNLAPRASYKLGLQGPSINVQTGCSTSLVAVHLACQSLLNGECDLALAGGVSISVSAQTGYVYKEGGILSPDGRCRAFDAQAQGTINGNGVGLVVLKRLAEAIADGDCIHAVIKGSAINNDGSLKVGYTAPSIEGQAEVITEALAMAGVEPETISYIEAHGTGTSLGDPIEIAALTQAFHTRTQNQGFCALGSLKTNIGHLDTAAGVAGLIKTVLALQHQQLPASLHFEVPNPQIDFANSPFYVNTTLSEWKTSGSPRRAGVSSFGIGGTNAHVILEEAPAVAPSSPSRPWQVLVLSAKTHSALDKATANLAAYLVQHPDLNLADVAYTLQVGRRAFEQRRILICQDLQDAVKVLQSLDPQRVVTHSQQSAHPSVVFMFPGQGAQHINMGRELYEIEPIFQEQVDRCCELLQPHLGLDLRTVLYPSPAQVETARQQLTQTAITQPALFVIEYALAQVWLAWGVHPQAMIGHSIGEYVAACLAGVFSLEDALSLVALRGRVMQQLPAGAMLAVSLPQEEIMSLLCEELSLAASNAPSLGVVSGPLEAVDTLQTYLTEQGINSRRLHTSHAFHSQMVEPIIQPFIEQLGKVKLHPATISFVSNVTGTWITAVEATEPGYWARHLRQTVRFSEGVNELLKQPARALLEVGPGRTLSTFTKQHQTDKLVLASMRHPHEQQSDVAFLLKTLGRLWLAGVPVDWSGFYAQERRQRLPLPTYPFERQKYWIESQSSSVPATLNQECLPCRKPNIADWFYIPSWQKSRSLEPFAREGLKTQPSRWLAFVDTYELGSQLAERLEQANQHVITVSVGEQFARLEDDTYTINPRQPNDYDALLQTLDMLDRLPDAIAHLWGMTPQEPIYSLNQGFEANQDLGFYSLLFLAQALGKQAITDPLQIIVVTNNLHDVIGEERLSPEKATVLGPCRVIGQEYPNITCQSVDVMIPESKAGQRKLVDQLIVEFTAPTTDLVVAYRGRHRWVQTFEAARLDTAIEGKTRLREGGAYLITGGLGGIGLALAEYLAQTVRAKLILVGRSSFPKKAEWRGWLATHSGQDEVSCKIQKLEALEKLGSEVMVISADVANLEQMQAVKVRAYKRFGEIHGIIHAAGVAGGGMIQLKAPETAASVLAPKVQGTLILDAIFKDAPLDFLVLCSSLSSVLGGFGQVDYCAANAFLDKFAHRNNAGHGPLTITINWCAWQRVGMAVNTAVPDTIRQQREASLKEGIAPQEGTDVFSRILDSGLPQVIVSTQDLQTRIARHDSFSSLEEKLGKIEPSQPTHVRPNLGSAYVAPCSEVEQTVANVWQQVLGIDRVGIHDNFFELGGHSLLATQVISQLRKNLQIELPLRSLFEQPTVAELAAAIKEILIHEIEELTEDEAQSLLQPEMGLRS